MLSVVQPAADKVCRVLFTHDENAAVERSTPLAYANLLAAYVKGQ